MSAVVIDAGALIAIERNDRTVIAMLRAAQQIARPVKTNANIVAQVWRDRRGRQASLARALSGMEIAPVLPEDGRAAGVLLGENRSSDVVDATIVVLLNPGDVVITSDPEDIGALINTRRINATVIGC